MQKSAFQQGSVLQSAYTCQKVIKEFSDASVPKKIGALIFSLSLIKQNTMWMRVGVSEGWIMNSPLGLMGGIL